MIKDTIVDGAQNAPHRSLYHALGLTKEEQSRPLIGIVSSHSEQIEQTETKLKKLKGRKSVLLDDWISNLKMMCLKLRNRKIRTIPYLKKFQSGMIH